MYSQKPQTSQRDRYSWERIATLSRYLSAMGRLAIGVLGLATVSLAVAQSPKGDEGKCYSLVKGKQYLMCRSFEANLNQFCSAPPMACRLQIAPAFKKEKFSFPAWQTLDPVSNVDLLAEHFKSRVPVAQDCTGPCADAWRQKRWNDYRDGLLERISQGKVSLSKALVDINRDGKRETVLRMDGGKCDPFSAHSFDFPAEPNLAVLKEGTEKVDPDYARSLRRSNYDVLIHDGRVYLTYWGKWNSKGDMAIYEVGSGPGLGVFAVAGSVCEFRYIGEK